MSTASRGAAAHPGDGLAFDPVTGAWHEASSGEWSSAELDAAMAARIPVLMRWLEDTDVKAYLLDAGLDAASLDRLGRMLRD